MNILIKLPNWLGDTVMLTPTICLIQKVIPKARFVLIGNRLSTSLFVENETFIKIFIDDTKSCKGFFKRINATMALALSVNEYLKESGIGEFDYVLNTQNNFFSAMLLCKIHSKLHIGYSDKSMFGIRKFLITNPVKFKSGRTPLCTHQVLSYSNLLLALLPTSFYEEILRSNVDLLSHANYNKDSNLAQNIIFTQTPELKIFLPISTKRRQKLLAISPGASYGESKMWLTQYFIETIIRLAKKGYSIRIYGGKDEIARNEMIYNKCLEMLDKDCKIENLSGKTTIQELINSMNECALYIGNDSGSTHIAKALKMSGVVLYGPTPIAWGRPWSINKVKITDDYYYADSMVGIQKKLPCMPCKKRVCPLKHHNCMKLITPDEVVGIIESLS